MVYKKHTWFCSLYLKTDIAVILDQKEWQSNGMLSKISFQAQSR